MEAVTIENFLKENGLLHVAYIAWTSSTDLEVYLDPSDETLYLDDHTIQNYSMDELERLDDFLEPMSDRDCVAFMELLNEELCQYISYQHNNK